ncbi:MAG TPA: ABC transporter ATP-binding protein [Oligoflexia bacterium]|nr:ABC transporter ATP-binding protein [Oligoflexia bacterium]
MADTLILASGLKKRFSRDLKRSLRYAVTDCINDLLLRRPEAALRPSEFWALDDVSFAVARGDTLGVIGPNGAGKSTLLKLLTGIIRPDAGMAQIRGRVGALIELGAGFNPLLTGRENILANAALLGISRAKLRRDFDSIVAFSGLEQFIDSPVRSYSSGMKVRLGFAIAIHTDPDVLIIDEVLAVGDAGFRAKCYNAIFEISKRAAVLFVSHSLQHVARICSSVLVLKAGKVEYLGTEVDRGLAKYLSFFETQDAQDICLDSSRITAFCLAGFENEPHPELPFGSPIEIVLKAAVERRHKQLECNVSFLNKGVELLAQCSSRNHAFHISNDSDELRLRIALPNLHLSPGYYTLSATIRDAQSGTIICWRQAGVSFYVTGRIVGDAPVQLQGEWSIL